MVVVQCRTNLSTNMAVQILIFYKMVLAFFFKNCEHTTHWLAWPWKTLLSTRHMVWLQSTRLHPWFCTKTIGKKWFVQGICHPCFIEEISRGIFLITLVQLSNYSTSESNITRQNCSEQKWVSMRTTVRSKQSEPCERTAEREVSMLENNLALFVYSKPCANFVVWISFTLFTHTRTTLKLLKSWTNSSTRESGHHQPKLLWKEIGLNVDNNPKQAMRLLQKVSWTQRRLFIKWHLKLFANIRTIRTHIDTTLENPAGLPACERLKPFRLKFQAEDVVYVQTDFCSHKSNGSWLI